MTRRLLPTVPAPRPRGGTAALLGLALFALAVLVAPAATAQLAVYTDSLQNGFTDWSWGTRNLAQTAVVHSGTAAISFEPDAWAGLFFHRDAGFTGTEYEAIELWVRGSVAGGQQLTVADRERREPRGVGGSPRGLRRRRKHPGRELGEGDGAVLGARPFDRQLGRRLASGFLRRQPGDALRRRHPAPGAHGPASPAARRRRGDDLGRPDARPAAGEPADLRRELRVGGPGRAAEVARAALGRELGDPLQLAERHVEQGDGLVLHERPRGQRRPRATSRSARPPTGSSPRRGRPAASRS